MASPLGVILNSINNKGPLLEKEFIDKEYVPFIVNKSLSYFVDVILFVAELDRLPKMPKYDQYLFYYHSIPKGRRFQSWHKPEKDKYLKAVAEYYNYSDRKAVAALKLLDGAQCEEIARRIDKGGRK